MTWTAVLRSLHQGETLARILMNKALERMVLSGVVVDIGAGGTAPSYMRHLRLDNGAARFSLDINPRVRPDVIADAERLLPFRAASLDAVLCMNVLEHTWDFRTVLLEAHRALRPGGRFIGSTPFLYPVHPFPDRRFDDFFRYTDVAITRLLVGTGYGQVHVESLGVGPASAALFILEFHVRPLLARIPFLRAFLFGAAWLFDRVFYFTFLRIKHHIRATPYVLMYVFTGIKMNGGAVS